MSPSSLRAVTTHKLFVLFAISTIVAGCGSASSTVRVQRQTAAQSGDQTPTKSSSGASTRQADPSEGPLSTGGESEVYVAKRGDTTTAIARQYLTRSSMITVADFDQAIRKANGITKGTALGKGQKVTIPFLEKQPVVEKSRSYPRDTDIHAIYLTAIMAGSARGMAIVQRWHELGGNAVVFDIKDSDGSINVPFDHPLAPKRRPAISNLPKFVRWLHSMDMHAIARIALFRDENIAVHHPELAVHSRATGKPWLENGKQVWADSSNLAVQDYNIAVAKSVADSGVDEIQFDYVRFPAEGNQKDAQFHFESEKTIADGKPLARPLERRDVIAAFLDRAYTQLHPKGVLISIDVFGIMAWQRSVDLSHTGQDIVMMAKHCDVISPMIYPSHFFKMDGIASPGDAPEHFISASMERFRRITAGSGVVLRPWLQAFGWRTKTYSPQYIETQVRTSKEHGGIGFLLWNARNDYSKPYLAMPVMSAAPATYFGKADLPPVEAQKPTKPIAKPMASKPAA